MSISRDQAKELAIEHVRNLDLRGYRYQFVRITYDENWSGEWGAIFDVYTPAGHLMDGPVVFAIEKDTGRVRGFEAK